MLTYRWPTKIHHHQHSVDPAWGMFNNAYVKTFYRKTIRSQCPSKLIRIPLAAIQLKKTKKYHKSGSYDFGNHLMDFVIEIKAVV